jgi:signal transduction histidine kinase
LPASTSPAELDDASDPRGRSTTIAYIVGFALLLCAAAAAWIMAFRAAEAERLVAHTNEVRKVARDLFSMVQDAESGTRGYVITGDPEFLAAYTQATQSVPPALEKLRKLTGDNPSQEARLADLEHQIAAKLQLGGRYVALIQAGQPDAAKATVGTKEGKQLMDQIRSDFAAFDEEESELLARRQSEASSLRYGLLAVIATALFAAAALAVLVTLASRRTDRRLREANERLESRVAERTRSLSESEGRLRLAQEAGGIGLWDWDVRADKIAFIGTAFQRWGIDPSELQPNIAGFTRAVHPEDRARFDADLQAALSGERSLDTEFRVTDREGRVRALACRAEVHRDHSGPYRMLGVNADVTDRRAAADALEQLNTELEKRVLERTADLEAEGAKRLEAEALLRQSQKMEAVGQLTGGVAHDFNNLLTAILLNADVLADRMTDDKLRPLAEATRMAAERGADLTKRLLAFGRRQTLEPRPTDVNDLVVGMEQLMRRTLGEHIAIDIRAAPELWPATVDPGQLEAAVVNLALNARDAMPQGGRITIETGNVELDDGYAAQNADVRPGDYIMIAVSDNGTGMTADVLGRAFEPFFTTKEVGRGTGLGLSMVYGFVKQSGGHARIYSEVGVGTVVRLYLPRSDVPAAATAIRQRPAGELPTGGETILLVEDDPLVRKHTQTQLLALGYRVVAAENAVEALDRANEGTMPDLLFTDIVMPGPMNGRELAEQLRERWPGLKVLYTSGFSHGMLDMPLGGQAPPKHLLGKPFRRRDLATKVREVLDEAAAA